MKRRDTLLVLPAFVLAGLMREGSEVQAQNARSRARVAILSTGSATSSGHIVEAFKQAMRTHGYVEGASVDYVIAYADGQANRLDGLARDLIGKGPDVLVGASPQVIVAFQRATSTIPIVMAQASDPVANGFVVSLARPGGNITGIATQYEEILPKIVEILLALAPNIERIGVLVNETSPSNAKFWNVSDRAVKALGKKALRFSANRTEDIEPAFAAMRRDSVQAAVVVGDPFFLAYREKIAELALRQRLPVGYAIPEHVSAGGLFSYGPDLIANYRHAAQFVDQLLKGAKPANLPVEQPTRFELIINRNTAKVLGLAIPQSVLLRADKLID